MTGIQFSGQKRNLRDLNGQYTPSVSSRRQLVTQYELDCSSAIFSGEDWGCDQQGVTLWERLGDDRWVHRPRPAGYQSAVIDAGIRRARGLWISFAHRCSLVPIDLGGVLVTGSGKLSFSLSLSACVCECV